MPTPKKRDLGDGKKPLRLSAKQLAFVEHYMVTWNGTDAARAAGYQGSNHVLSQTAYMNLQRPAVKEAIKRRVSTKIMMQEEALARTAEIARGDLGRFLVEDPNTHEISLDYQKLRAERQQHLVKSVAARSDGKLGRVEFYSALHALELILKATGAFEDGVTINLPPFDPAVWAKQADARLNKVEELFDPYESMEGIDGDGPNAGPE